MAKVRTKKKSAPRLARRRLHPDDRRAELLEAAIEVLGKLGPSKTRVEDVVRLADAAKGTFYLYFPSWDDLLVAVREHLVSSYAVEVRRRLAGSSAVPWSVIEDECVRFVDYVVRLGDLHEAIFHNPNAVPPEGKGRSAESLIAEMLALGAASGSCRAVPGDLAAPLLFSVLHATADGIARDGGRKERIGILLNLLRAWLRA